MGATILWLFLTYGMLVVGMVATLLVAGAKHPHRLPWFERMTAICFAVAIVTILISNLVRLMMEEQYHITPRTPASFSLTIGEGDVP
jgi:hypothetical protein